MTKMPHNDSDPLRIKMVCLAFKNWMVTNKIERYEVTRAMSLLDREEAENRAKREFKGDQL